VDPPQTHPNDQAIQYETTSLVHEPNNKKVKVKLFKMLHWTPLKISSRIPLDCNVWRIKIMRKHNKCMQQKDKYHTS
jgi:hypothetical protein